MVDEGRGCSVSRVDHRNSGPLLTPLVVPEFAEGEVDLVSK